MLKKKRPKIKILTSVTVAVAVGFVGLGVATSAQAGATVSDEVTPAIRDQGTAFYTEQQIDAVWNKIVTNYPRPLPLGKEFPTKAPAFFHPEGEEAVFEIGLPKQIAARYWRCSWLEVGNAAKRHGRAVDTNQTAEELRNYRALPGIASKLDVSDYESKMSKYAESIGLDQWKAEYQVECEGFK